MVAKTKKAMCSHTPVLSEAVQDVEDGEADAGTPYKSHQRSVEAARGSEAVFSPLGISPANRRKICTCKKLCLYYVLQICTVLQKTTKQKKINIDIAFPRCEKPSRITFSLCIFALVSRD
jgi:hypothetical protein